MTEPIKLRRTLVHVRTLNSLLMQSTCPGACNGGWWGSMADMEAFRRRKVEYTLNHMRAAAKHARENQE